MKELFIVPNNDGEAVEIQKLLRDNGCEFLVTNQPWGASWESLEPDILDKIYHFNGIVYGIELSGHTQMLKCVNIDHHKYDNDDRRNILSSLEQVANIIKVNLTEYQKAVSDNDKGYIDLMVANEYSQEIIDAVRLQDRIAQGITREHEDLAIEAIKCAVEYDNLTIVKLQHSKCATVTDRLYGKYKNLLIICNDEHEVDFYGDYNICLKLQTVFNGWIGGGYPNGFWGNYIDNISIVVDYIKKCLCIENCN